MGGEFLICNRFDVRCVKHFRIRLDAILCEAKENRVELTVFPPFLGEGHKKLDGSESTEIRDKNHIQWQMFLKECYDPDSCKG